MYMDVRLLKWWKIYTTQSETVIIKLLNTVLENTYLLSQISLSSFLHFSENHGRNFFRSKCLCLPTSNINLNVWFSFLFNHLFERIITIFRHRSNDILNFKRELRLTSLSKVGFIWDPLSWLFGACYLTILYCFCKMDVILLELFAERWCEDEIICMLFITVPDL